MNFAYCSIALVILGCSKSEDANGRFQLLSQRASQPWMQQNDIVLRIDTQTGKTWRMNYERIEDTRLGKELTVHYDIEGWVSIPESFYDVRSDAMKQIEPRNPRP